MFAAGTVVTGGLVSVQVTALMESAMKMLWIAKVKSMVLAWAIAAAVLAGVSVPVGIAVAGAAKEGEKPDASAQTATGTNSCCPANNYELALQAMGSAKTNTDSGQKTLLYTDAISRFSHIEASHPDSTNAPCALFNKALTYERMNRLEEAVVEYETLVKRYPGNELGARAIGRMGGLLMKKGRGIESKTLLVSDPIKKEELNLQEVEIYRTAAHKFNQLNEQSNNHELAGKMKLLSGQFYMRANDVGRAVDAFTTVTEEKTAAPEVIAEAMYWLVDCYYKSKKYQKAYQTFTVLKWDYPETTWGRHLGGRLTDPIFAAGGQEDASLTTEPTLARPAAARTETDASIAARHVLSNTTSMPETPEDALLQKAKELRAVTLWAKRLQCDRIPLQEAVAAYRKVVDLYPNTAAAGAAILAIAELHESLGYTTQPLALYQVIAETLPNTPEGGAAFGKIIDGDVNNEHYERALAMIEKYVADPKAFGRDRMLLRGCFTAYQLKDYAKARSMIEQLIWDHPESQHAEKGISIRPKILERLESSSRESIADNRSQAISNDVSTNATQVVLTNAANIRLLPEEDVANENLTAAKAARVVQGKVVQALSEIPVKAIPAEAAQEVLVEARTFLRSKDKARAAEQFSRILNNRSPNVAAEAQYWMAEIYRESRLITEAYRGYKKLIWTYPESTWAKYARGRLASEKAFREIGDTEGKAQNSMAQQAVDGDKSRIRFDFPDIADVSETP